MVFNLQAATEPININGLSSRLVPLILMESVHASDTLLSKQVRLCLANKNTSQRLSVKVASVAVSSHPGFITPAERLRTATVFMQRMGCERRPHSVEGHNVHAVVIMQSNGFTSKEGHAS